MASISKTVNLGQRQHEYTADISAEVWEYNDEEGTTYEVGVYEIDFWRGTKQMRGCRHKLLEARFYREYDIEDINRLLIESEETYG